MAKETTVRARIDEGLKQEAEDILRQLGLTTSQAINLYFSQIVLHRGMPFDVRLPEEPAEK
ncbi:type II toxin-antitoxin system RelB/DinJ family antitoxin [Endozoicomonas sp.]|uniref:type II toxin-antitoxin system RelB/DinJ family antitoxin n=1 Tax=Endozoicomonas sp. TaxID=1892382 RepID=UPI0028845BAA|nr:type II toxin-antitoxin system RelB/DinJ family antitoxin [Endozoicomonas sp.]